MTDIRETLIAEKVLAWATYLGLAATIWPAIVGIVDGFKQGSSLAVVAWIAYLTAVLFWIVRAVVKRPKRLLPESRVFQPFTDIQQLRLWPREDSLNSLLTRFSGGSAGETVVVVGPSGAGKTVLLGRLLPMNLGLDARTFWYFDQYQDFNNQFDPKLRALATRDLAERQRTVIVLDQFEQMLARLQRLAADVRASEWASLNRRIDDAKAAGARVVIAIRYEWYYDLRGLGASVPAPHAAIYVGGPRATDLTDSTLVAVIDQLQNALGNDRPLAEEVVKQLTSHGSLLLLEAQIVGSSLESLHKSGERIDAQYLTDKLSGVNGAIDLYFDQVLAGAPDRRIALKVLAALSTSTRFRRQENITNIYDVLFEDSDEISEAIDYLQRRGLLMNRGDWGQLELAHDFVAEYFNSRCGYELRPTDRDNVVFHLEAWPSHLGPAVLERQDRTPKRSRLGWVVFGILLLVMTARLMGFGLDWILVGTLQEQYTTADWLFDGTYVPIFLAHGAWSIYITLFYTRVFSMLRERPLARFASRMVPVFMAICVVTAAFVPYVWLLSIGLGGVFLGLKLVSLSMNGDLSAGARARMGEFGRTSLAALSVIAALGAGGVWISFALQDLAEFQSYWTSISVFAGLAMTLPALALAPYHVRRPAVAEFLGLLARSPRGVVPRSAAA